MKSKKRKRIGVRFGDVFQNFTVNQLAWIGAVVIAYNEAESSLHRVFAASFYYPGDSYQISSRIRTVKDIIFLIEEMLPKLGLAEKTIEMIHRSLTGEGFTQLRSWRGGVVHSKLVDTSSGLAEAAGYDGKREAILLSEEALSGLCNRVQLVQKELDEICTILSCAKRLKFGTVADDQHKARLEELVQAAIDRCAQHQNQRRSLPPIPAFPEAPDIYEIELHIPEVEHPAPGVRPSKVDRSKDK